MSTSGAFGLGLLHDFSFRLMVGKWESLTTRINLNYRRLYDAQSLDHDGTSFNLCSLGVQDSYDGGSARTQLCRLIVEYLTHLPSPSQVDICFLFWSFSSGLLLNDAIPTILKAKHQLTYLTVVFSSICSLYISCYKPPDSAIGSLDRLYPSYWISSTPLHIRAYEKVTPLVLDHYRLYSLLAYTHTVPRVVVIRLSNRKKRGYRLVEKSGFLQPKKRLPRYLHENPPTRPPQQSVT
ncbi:hypothetical protein F4778DRAFT_237987 [Xylariomycetidae sp. FL2044]|nr:hypothetical protein F4778DRAFT_237987 [Xylariomycetidae sp. FL2044]